MNPDDPEPPQPPEQPRKRKRGGNRKTGIERAETLRRRVEKGTNRHRSVGHKPLPEDADPAHLIHHARPYLHHLASRNYSPATIERREQAFKRFFGWTLERGIARADEITMPVLEAYQAWLWRYRKPDGKTMGVNTQRGELLIVQAYFRWLVRQRVILSNPASDIELPRQESRLPPDALTLRQVDALLSIPDTSDPLGIRDRAILETLYSTAIRRAELTKLRLEDLNPERATLRVFGKGNKERVVPVGQKALHWLDRYLEEVRPRLLIRADVRALFLTGFGEGFPAQGLGQHVSALLRRADIPKGGAHILRHTCATHLLEGGADQRYIQQLLGHASADTTALYAQVSIIQLQQVHARCHPAERPRTNGENPLDESTGETR
jgi:integrase/recombinase XerD